MKKTKTGIGVMLALPLQLFKVQPPIRLWQLYPRGLMPDSNLSPCERGRQLVMQFTIMFCLEIKIR